MEAGHAGLGSVLEIETRIHGRVCVEEETWKAKLKAL